MAPRPASASAEELALHRLAKAAQAIGDVLLAGDRDPSRREAEELELACIAFAREGTRRAAPADARASAATAVIRAALATVDSLIPDEQDAVYGALVSHIRSRRPECIAPLDHGFAPTEPVPTRAP